MKIRPVTKEDLSSIQTLLKNNTSIDLLESSLKESVKSALIDGEKGPEGFIIIRKIGGINELSHWHLEPEHSLVLKATAKGVKGLIATHEPKSEASRIRILKENGFKKLRETNGLFFNEKAVTLIKQD
jgi:hypothetical protein